jgi:hypothetical protein
VHDGGFLIGLRIARRTALRREDPAMRRTVVERLAIVPIDHFTKTIDSPSKAVESRLLAR